jgi:hypothetical protein
MNFCGGGQVKNAKKAQTETVSGQHFRSSEPR